MKELILAACFLIGFYSSISVSAVDFNGPVASNSGVEAPAEDPNGGCDINKPY